MRTATYEAVTRIETPAYAEALHTARNVALFAVAPLVALAYVVALPFVGLAMLGWLAVRTLRERA